MKVGDLVKLATIACHDHFSSGLVGVIIGFAPGPEPTLDDSTLFPGQDAPIVYWNEEFPSEIEHTHHIEVIHGAR